MLSVFFLFSFLFAAAHTAGAQTAAEMDELLDSQEISYAQAARFVLAASDPSMEKLSAGEAFGRAQKAGWIPGDADPEKPLTWSGLSLLIMKSFKKGGGALYTLFSNPRYAYRELEYNRLLPAGSDPGFPVSGEALLYILHQAAAGDPAGKGSL
jgi:hypothetical protein